ncbi:MAG: hypothetical protein VX640_03165 [Pseudomonadota bacterium]|nr:hypothetical protein [Pseudomonadota bacterium]
MSYALALRKPGVRRALSRVAANLTAVVAVSAIFGLKAYIDTQGRAHAATPDPYEARVMAAGLAR